MKIHIILQLQRSRYRSVYHRMNASHQNWINQKVENAPQQNNNNYIEIKITKWSELIIKIFIFVQRKYPSISDSFYQNIFQQQNKFMQQIVNQTKSATSQQNALTNALEVLDHQHSINVLNLSQKRSHFVYCKLAQSYFALRNYQKAMSNAELGLKINFSCGSCLNIAFQSFQQLVNGQRHLLQQTGFEEVKSSEQFFEWKRKIIESQTNTKIATFLDQLNSNGASFCKVELVQDSPQYRKIVAKQLIKKDEVIMYIPKKQLITLETTRFSSLVRKIQDKRVPLRSPKHCLLSIYLLQQKQLGKNSPYYLYIDLLPKAFTNFPLNYTEQEKKQLKGSAFIEQIEQKIIDMNKDYQTICSVDSSFLRFSYQQFQWARMTVCSRIFGIAINNNKTDALVPLADMLNHHIPKQTSWFYSDTDEGFVIKSMKSLQAGSQIFDSYGYKCNSRFLLNYGFTIRENPSNQVSIMIPIKVFDADMLANRQVYLRINKQIQSREFQDMIGVARFAVLAQQQIKQMQYTSSPQNMLYQSDENEAKAWQLLITILNRHLQQYPTSYKEDSRLLTEKNIPQNLYNCIVLRMGEKQILLFYIMMAKKVIKFIQTHRRNNQLRNYEPYLLHLPYY